MTVDKLTSEELALCAEFIKQNPALSQAMINFICFDLCIPSPIHKMPSVLQAEVQETR